MMVLNTQQTILLSAVIVSTGTWLVGALSRMARTSLPVSVSHTSRVRSSALPETRYWLLGLKATELIQFLWPRKVCSSDFATRSQPRTIWSAPPEARSRPAGEKATLLTGPVWPLSDAAGESGAAGWPALFTIIQTRMRLS